MRCCDQPLSALFSRGQGCLGPNRQGYAMEKGNAVVTTVSGAAAAAGGVANRAVDVVVEVGAEAAAATKDRLITKSADAAIESTTKRMRRGGQEEPAQASGEASGEVPGTGAAGDPDATA